jgi:hypothetical protein
LKYHQIIWAVVILFSSVIESYGQDSYWEVKQAKADTVITELKSSIILIQLNSENTDSRSKYRRPESHGVVTSSFKADFHFCKVLFYYAADSQKVFNYQLSEVAFFNYSLDKVSNDSINGYATYIGVFGRIKEDSSRNFEGYYYVEGPNGTEKRSRYSEIPENGFTALILYDSLGHQLDKPLPFYVRTYDYNFVKRNPITVIKKMNAKLKVYYQKREIQGL